MAEALVENGHKQEQTDNEADAPQISTLAIWIHQLIYLIKTLPHDIRFKHEIIENIRTTLDNLLKARSGKEFYTDYCNHRNPVESYCRDCRDFLDAPCVQYHKEIKLLIPHRLFNFMGRKVKDKHVLNFAPKPSCRIAGHSQKEILFYCQDCSMLLCLIGRRQHEGHILITLNKGNEMEKMFDDIMQSCGENPQCQLKEIRDLTNYIIISSFGVNLVQAVPCEENNFTKSADMEKGTLPDDVQNSLDSFQDLHPRNSS
ncbi:Hypothetical predicted protein [Mytilus galloprovincialis]|uniref:B box-type domain-containing protein n=1 Tax=Mytilus galloprovincialis TaxID=29158 RepID=A0A8B6G1F2_MYTGA|nr:Hypothetical predicted protein [Mytilus galloprovincialis]